MKTLFFLLCFFVCFAALLHGCTTFLSSLTRLVGQVSKVAVGGKSLWGRCHILAPRMWPVHGMIL